MHALMQYICDELEELERKAEKEGKLSMAEVQYMDTLLHSKKNLLKADEMYEESKYFDEGGSYARDGRGRGPNARRDAMGRYSSRYDRGMYRGGSYEGYSREGAREDLMDDLHQMEREAGDEETKRMIKKWIKQVEQG